jgi:hypothetical protein
MNKDKSAWFLHTVAIITFGSILLLAFLMKNNSCSKPDVTHVTPQISGEIRGGCDGYHDWNNCVPLNQDECNKLLESMRPSNPLNVYDCFEHNNCVLLK